MPMIRDLTLALSRGPSGVVDLARATVELAIARYRFARLDLLTMLASQEFDAAISAEMGDRIDRVAFAIPRVAARLPWRADCLVQALAARHWLACHGIASTIHLGARANPALPLDAHAWLTVGERVVTGGDVSAFAPFRRGTQAAHE